MYLVFSTVPHASPGHEGTVIFLDHFDASDYFYYYYFGGLECVGHSFAYVGHFFYFERCLDSNPAQRAAVTSKRATNLATHLPYVATHLPSLATHLPT